MDKNIKKVLVAGHFDALHPGHVKFFEEASSYGTVDAVVGSDSCSIINKGKRPLFTQQERAYMVKALGFVDEVFTPEDPSLTNFEPYMKDHDIFIINEDGHTAEKEQAAKRNNLEYIVLERKPKENFKAYSSTQLREDLNFIPQRLDITGFYDQKLLNSVHPGSVILANIEPIKAEDRSGLSSSTTNVIRKLFGPALPKHLSPNELAKIIFAVENPPEREYISGVVDQLGICMPGINKLEFDNEYFPSRIKSIEDPSIIKWLSSHLYLVQTRPRPEGYVVFDGREDFSREKVKRLAELSEKVWRAINDKDIINFGSLINEVHTAQKNMIPGYESKYVKTTINHMKGNSLGVKLMGAGGYGYMMVVSDEPVEAGEKVEITYP